jgi:alpha-beta hydrolase superfamily lysophospholipase
MVEKNPLRKIQPPGVNEDYYSVEDYFASIKRDYPAMAAIWGDLIQEQGLHEITQNPEGKVVDKMTDSITQALQNTLKTYVPEDSKIKVPTLCIYAISNVGYYISDDWMTEEQKAQIREFFETVNDPWLKENIEQFQRNIRHAQVVVIPEGHHYCFIKEEERVYEAMRKFLLG